MLSFCRFLRLFCYYLSCFQVRAGVGCSGKERRKKFFLILSSGFCNSIAKRTVYFCRRGKDMVFEKYQVRFQNILLVMLQTMYIFGKKTD